MDTLRRVQLDLTKDLIPQLVALTSNPDPEIAKWAQENLQSELERVKFAEWLAKRGIDESRLALERPTLYQQFRQEQRPKLTVVRKKGRGIPRS
jgi:hypothetical protein